MKGIILKKGKESIFEHRHHWIFSGAIESFPDKYQDGEIAAVFSYAHDLLGFAYFNRKSGLQGRIVSFGASDPYKEMRKALESAIDLRKEFFDDRHTNAYRVVNGEGDRLPGLIIDRYGPYLVLQSGTLGMDQLKEWIAQQLAELISFDGLWEKSTSPSRKEEGLTLYEGLVAGVVPKNVWIKEEGHSFFVEIIEGQKTGFFLDQRQMRLLIGSISKEKRVLNAFCYSGGFSVYALAGDALNVDSVDVSKEAIELCQKNVLENGFEPSKNGFFVENVFDFLKKKPLDYDIVILDPPAFAKKKKDIANASKGYRDLNKLAFQKMPPKSILLTCSCSYHVDSMLFQKLVFQAANEAKRNVKLIGRHILGIDHPINLNHPEGDYLKALCLYID